MENTQAKDLLATGGANSCRFGLSGTGAITPPRIAPQGIAIPYRTLFSRYRTLSRYTPHTDPYRIDICLDMQMSK